MQPRLIISKEWHENKQLYEYIPRYESGDPLISVRNAKSLVITRNVNPSIGLETFIPSRLLYGLLPTALLEQYLFWQNDTADFIGELRENNQNFNSTPSILKVKLTNAGNNVSTAKVIRIPIEINNLNKTVRKRRFLSTTIKDAGDGNIKESHDPSLETGASLAHLNSDKQEILLNLLYATPNSQLSNLASLLMRLENLSHCLAWCKKGGNSIDYLELPRLRLSFIAKTEKNSSGKDVSRLYSLDHAGLFISNYRCEMTESLLTGIPHSLILENVDHELFVLTPGAALPIRPSIIEDRFPTDVVFDRCNQQWLNNLDVRHYLYPIHQSKTFLFTPTLASALYLMLLRFFNRQYDKVCELAPSCVTDAKLTAEEKQIFAQLEYVKNDFHADAHAARLKIYLSTLDTEMICPWDVTSEMEYYLSKISHVSFTCRLSFDEELIILQKVNRKSCELVNRYRYLRAIESNKTFINTALPRPITIGRQFDSIIDQTVISNDSSIFDSLHTTSYRRPVQKNNETQEILYYIGPEAMKMMNTWLLEGFDLAGGSHNLGFLFFYELFTKSIKFSFINGDSTYNLAILLMRMIPKKQALSHSLEMSILRAFSLNPEIALHEECPRFQDTRKYSLIATMFQGGSGDFAKLIKSVKSFFMKHKKNIKWPNIYQAQRPKSKVLIASNIKKSRLWLTNYIEDYNCSKRLMKPIDLIDDLSDFKAFCNAPLDIIDHGLSSYIVELNRKERGLLPIDNNVPFDLSHSSLSKNYIAKSTLQRLKDDCKAYATYINGNKTAQLITLLEKDIDEIISSSQAKALTVAIEQIGKLLKALNKIKINDRKYVAERIKIILKLANHTGRNNNSNDQKLRLAFILAKYAGTEYTFTFEQLVSLLLSNNSQSEIRKMNPFLTDLEIQRLFDLTVDFLLHSNRLGQAHRCITAARILYKNLKTMKKDIFTNEQRQAMAQEIKLKSMNLARLLLAKRHYLKKEKDTNDQQMKLYYDPRFLLFEFTYNLMLRKSQVVLVEQFMNAYKNGESRCHQMIMGAGKTTVVAPLLTLILANGTSLVTQVVPPALLEFSRSIMRSRFSAILRKPVYTFHFDRFTTVDKVYF